MKLVREHINEKFTEDSDPIQDMGIGIRSLIKKYIQKTRYESKQRAGFFDPFPTKDTTISDDNKINVNNHSYISDQCGNLPEYINFGTITQGFSMSECELTTLRGAPDYVGGDFHCENNKLTSLKYAPKIVRGDFYCKNNAIKFTQKDVKAVCKVYGAVYV